MASGFFRKLLGGRTPVLTPQLTEALADVEKLAQSRPSLQGPAEVLAVILPELFAEPAVEAAPPHSPEQARQKLSAGTPLLRGEPMVIDRSSLQRRWQVVCAAVSKQQVGTAPAPIPAAKDLDLVALLHGVLDGRPEIVTAGAESAGLDPSLTATALRLASYPALARLASQLAGVRQGVGWDQGYCPTCGSYPLLAEFRGLDQTRVLRCGLCASGWEFPRLRCPFCGNRDHRTLGYFHVEGEEARYRAATCEECRGYVKTASTLSALSEVQLLVVDLATLHLDLAAGERGFLVR